MLEQIKKLKEKILSELEEKVDSLEALRHIEKKYLGRKGELTSVFHAIKDIASEERREFGQLAQRVRQEVEEKFATLRQNFTRAGSALHDPAGDVTLPGESVTIGSLHPITQMIQKIQDVFSRMNFELVTGPEIETDYYNFEALNVPLGHPARDMQDTFYLNERYLLRTQTSTVQIHTMEKRKPPLRIISIGKCYRRDSDSRHSPMFHQFEGLMIDHSITLAHLKKILHVAMEEILEQKLKTRFRVSYFPFVEPGAEFDVSCTLCLGQGCSTCKFAGWLEMGGCGMVHPQVLRNVGIDPEEWQGFAFGFGVERTFMIKHRVDDIRLLFENDLRFLKQF